MSKSIYDVCIIGGGASGLIAAIESSRRGLSSVVVDKNKKPCKKLYATGNGRCNLTNDIWDDDIYYNNEFVDNVFDGLYRMTGMRQRAFILDYFNNLGIKTTNLNGYYYPRSLQASSVCWSILDAARSLGVDIINEYQVDTVSDFNDEYYEISGRDCDKLYAKSIVLAIGGMSGKGLGEADQSVTERLLSSLGIAYNTFRPGLTSVLSDEDMSDISGVRFKASVRVDNHHEDGEIQVSDKGLSGIVIMNMSGFLDPGAKLHINVLNKVDEDEFIKHFNHLKENFPNKKLIAMLNGYINDRLALYFVKKVYGDFSDITLNDITKYGMINLYQELTDWIVSVRELGSFDNSQATRGGIRTDQIDPYTMRLINKRSMYVTGEITDVIGKCGGYNLTYAFITGYIAGKSI